jgi:hypothetical protein
LTERECWTQIYPKDAEIEKKKLHGKNRNEDGEIESKLKGEKKMKDRSPGMPTSQENYSRNVSSENTEKK